MSRAPRAHGREATTVEVSSDRGVFMISVAAELAEMHPQTLRMYEARGLIEPQRSPKGTRLYSYEDVERLRRIQEMTNEPGSTSPASSGCSSSKSSWTGLRAGSRHSIAARPAPGGDQRRLEELRDRVRAEIVHAPAGTRRVVRAPTLAVQDPGRASEMAPARSTMAICRIPPPSTTPPLPPPPPPPPPPQT